MGPGGDWRESDVDQGHLPSKGTHGLWRIRDRRSVARLAVPHATPDCKRKAWAPKPWRSVRLDLRCRLEGLDRIAGPTVDRGVAPLAEITARIHVDYLRR